MKEFESVEILHVPREHNARAYILSRLVSPRTTNGNKTFIQQVLTEPSVHRHKNKTLMINEISTIQDWRTPIIQYITSKELPTDPNQRSRIKRVACSFTLVGETLFKRGLNIPMITSLGPTKAQEALVETHEGICWKHLGTKSLSRKILRAGFFWPTMKRDAKEYLFKCHKCQKFADMHIAPLAELTSLASPWPFAWWGIDLLGPFPKAVGQLKYLVVAIDYSTKWIEVEPLEKITSSNVLLFFT